jgi:acetyl-CoA acetyltransferase family protein
MNRDIVIVDGARTPVGTFMGSLKNVKAVDLGVLAAKAALKRSAVDPEWIDHVVFGNVLQTAGDAIYLARHIGLKIGVPRSRPALIVNRLCGSGLEAIVTGARMLLTGEARFVLAGGAENMSQAPFMIWGARDGWKLGQPQVEDYLWAALTDSFNRLPMALTAENLAERHSISREEQDRYALRSHQLAAAARDSGRLAQEIVAVEVPGRKGKTIVVEHDEHIRPDTTLESLARLKPRFKKDGTVTAGNASGINDCGAAVVVTTISEAKERGLKPLGRLVSWGTAGVDPDVMGIGPVPATRIALKRAGLSLDDIDLIEVNEAFAAQYLAVEKELGLDRDKVNVNGGGISIGHPLAATGTRITLSLLYELRIRGLRYGLSTMCIGGGQGLAAIVEAL